MNQPRYSDSPTAMPVHNRCRHTLIFGFVHVILLGCSGSPPVNCESNANGGAQATEPCGNTGGMNYAGGTAGMGGESSIENGGSIASGATSNIGDSLVTNGSFEMDQQPSALMATAAPSGWSMVSSASIGNLLHAVQSDGANDVPPAADGLNVARFDSLTSSSYREARSECFPIDANQKIAARYQVRIPAPQLPSGTKAAVKLWYYQDVSCVTASADRASDTQSATSNAAADVWELRQFMPSQNPPSDSLAARISIRACIRSGLKLRHRRKRLPER